MTPLESANQIAQLLSEASPETIRELEQFPSIRLVMAARLFSSPKASSILVHCHPDKDHISVSMDLNSISADDVASMVFSFLQTVTQSTDLHCVLAGFRTFQQELSK